MTIDNHITDKNTLKSWFRRGFKPLESQFAAWIDSYWHKSENIPTGSIAGLETILNSKAESAALQAHQSDFNNPHGVNKTQVGLDQVDNTADRDKPVSTATRETIYESTAELYEHIAIESIHKTSEQIRSEIVDSDLPDTMARKTEVDQKIVAHNDNDTAHPDIRNAVSNLKNGTITAGRSEYAIRLGTPEDYYTKMQLDTKINKHIRNVVYDQVAAKFTFIFEDGTTTEIDTPVENTVKDGRFDTERGELVLVLVSDQEIRIPAAGLVKVYTGKDTVHTTTVVSSDGKIAVDIKQGVIDKTLLSQVLINEIDNHLTQNGDTQTNITIFTEQSVRTNITSGDTHSVLFGKIKKWFSDLKSVAFTGSYNDLSNKPNAITWRPVVNSVGVISWSADDSTTIPINQNIRGPQGEPGPAGSPDRAGEIMQKINSQSEITFTKYVVCTAGAGVASSSDERFKKNTILLDGVLGKIGETRFFYYDWENEDGSLFKDQIGLSAQQLKEQFPQLVHECDDKRKTLTVDYSKYSVVVAKGLQEEKGEREKENQELKKEILELKKTVSDMKETMCILKNKLDLI